MISRNVTLEMNEDTYDCILESIFGLKPLPASRIPILNNLSITFINTMPKGDVNLVANYAPKTRAKTLLHINCK